MKNKLDAGCEDDVLTMMRSATAGELESLVMLRDVVFFDGRRIMGLEDREAMMVCDMDWERLVSVIAAYHEGFAWFVKMMLTQTPGELLDEEMAWLRMSGLCLHVESVRLRRREYERYHQIVCCEQVCDGIRGVYAWLGRRRS